MQPQKTLNKDEITANVDWLTMTTKNDAMGVRWYEEFVQRARANGATGTAFNRLVKHSTRLGFQMQDFESFTWGYSEQHMRYIIILKGGVAHSYWRKVILPPQVRVTRMDFAVTVTLRRQRNLVTEAYERLEKEGIPDGVKTKKFTKIQSFTGGDTLYVGSRHSEYFGRLYDRGAKSGEISNSVFRYEVEVHKPKADKLAQGLYEKLQESHPAGEEYNAIVLFVNKWFGDRGIEPVFSATDGYDITSMAPEMSVRTPTRRLAWLKTQVQPTVEDLMKLGLGKEVVEALGLELRQLDLLLPRPDEEKPED